MNRITDIIAPIKLLCGTHNHTARTGQGCFMNVIAYLNGEPQITDESPCVCPVVRPIAIWLNDFLPDGKRERMTPYIERAMGSATDDKAEIVRRAWLAVDLANACKEIAADAADAAICVASAARAASYAASAASYAANAAHAASAASYAAICVASAASAASYAANAAHHAASYAASAAIADAGFTFLDAALPQAPEPAPAVCERAQFLREKVSA